MTSSAHLFEDHMVHEMKNCVGGLAHKSKDRIKRGHQDGKCSERIYCCLTIF